MAKDGKCAPGAAEVRQALGESGDIVYRELTIGGQQALWVCLDGMAQTALLSDHVLRPLASMEDFRGRLNPEQILRRLLELDASLPEARETDSLEEAVESVLRGGGLLAFPRGKNAALFMAPNPPGRSVSETSNEDTIKASKEAFVERLRTNTALLRKRLCTRHLTFEEFSLGNVSHTRLCIAYLDDITQPALRQRVKEALLTIRSDGLLTPGMVEEVLAGRSTNPFPVSVSTERPDKLAIGLLQGHVGVLIDGLPTAYITPMVFRDFFSDPDDFSNHFLYAGFLRVLRYCAFFIALLAPSLYIAMTCFHFELLPTRLALAIQAAQSGVPFPATVEIPVMLLAVEIVYQAGLRLPKAVGHTVSILGGLIIGEAAVSAKFVSPGVVVVVATALICGYTVPSQDFCNAARLWRLLLVACTIAGELQGMVLGCMVLLLTLAVRQQFGVPYLCPDLTQGKGVLAASLFRGKKASESPRPWYLHPLRREKGGTP